MKGGGGGEGRFGGRGEVTVHNQTTEIEIQHLFDKHLHQMYTKSVNEVNESVNEMRIKGVFSSSKDEGQANLPIRLLQCHIHRPEPREMD